MNLRIWTVVALVVVTVAGCSAGPGTARAVVRAEAVAATPAGWRAETFLGVEVSVPKYWDYGVTGTQWCLRRGPGHAGRPYVGRPGSGTLVGCGPLHAAPEQDPAYRVDPGGTFVWFDTATGAAPTAGDRADEVLAGVRVVVQAPAQLRNRILATVHRTATDAHGCPTVRTFGTERPGVAVGNLTGVDVVTVCRYAVTGGEGKVASSTQLNGRAAASAIAAVADAPLGSAPGRCHELTATAYDVFDLVVHSREGTSHVVMRYDSCADRGFDDGHGIRQLTHRAVAPFTAGPNRISVATEELAGIVL